MTRISMKDLLERLLAEDIETGVDEYPFFMLCGNDFCS